MKECWWWNCFTGKFCCTRTKDGEERSLEEAVIERRDELQAGISEATARLAKAEADYAEFVQKYGRGE